MKKKQPISSWEIDGAKPWHSMLVLSGCAEELKKYPPYKLDMSFLHAGAIGYSLGMILIILALMCA